jgi:hypothetical protein
MSRALALAALAALLMGCASLAEGPGGWKTTTVEAEGWAPLVDADLLSAKKRALIEAQKKAVEKAVGVTVRADTRVDNSIALHQSISANMGGTIRRYDVLSEVAEGGFLKIRIRAAVLYRVASEHRPLKQTRFYVKIAGEKLTAALRSELANWDYPLVDSSEQADVVVTGVVETFGVADSRLGGLYSCKTKVSLDIADVPSGEVTHHAYEASAIDLDDRSAYDESLQKAGSLAGLDLATRFSAKAKPDSPSQPAESAQVAW